MMTNTNSFFSVNKLIIAIVALFVLVAGFAIFFAPSDVHACGTCCFDDDCGPGNVCVNGLYCRPKCTSTCTPGKTMCADTSYYYVCEKNSYGCYAWGTVKKCSGNYRCDNNVNSSTYGTCQPECTNACAAGEKRCSGTSSYQYCGYAGKFCLEWITESCGSGMKCTGSGSCVKACTDECSLGDRQCSGKDGYKTCVKSGDCTVWSVTNCGANEECEDGYCKKTCTNECTYGSVQCADSDSYKTCDMVNGCTKWSITDCASNKKCENGKCVEKCTSHYEKKCVGDDLYWYDSCGNKETLAEDCGTDTWTNNYRCSGNWVQRELTKRGCSFNSCFSITDWQNKQDCESDNKKCQNGGCVITCTDQCVSGTHECSGTSGRTCGYNGGECTSWGTYQTCDTKCYTCGDGTCNSSCGETKSNCSEDCGHETPTIDLTGPSTVTCQGNVTLTWVSTNATTCSASGAWSGTKATSGSETINMSSGSRTFTLTCTGEGGSASDTLTVNVENDTVTAEAGDDKEVAENGSVTLDGSASDGSDSIEYAWSCNGGSLSDSSVKNPEFNAPSVTSNTWFVCTIKVQNNCGSDTDTMNILVKNHVSGDYTVTLEADPDSGCADLDNVDLTARVETDENDDDSRDFTYYFYCDDDDSYDKVVNTSATSVTAKDICDYDEGEYTAKVKVTDNDTDRTATDTISIEAENCEEDDLDVSLEADPSSGCEPLENVTLTARILDEDGDEWDNDDNDDLKYYFGCEDSGSWDKIVTTRRTEVIVNDLCDYDDADTYTARIKVVNEDTDETMEDTAKIRVRSCGGGETNGDITIEKLVSNYSRGTDYADSVTATPGDIVSFKITVTADGGDVDNIIVTDVLPDKIYSPRDLRIDGGPEYGSIESGIKIGDLNEDESAVITFTASLNGPSSFNYGQTTLINTAAADGESDTATIYVSRTQVEGATTVSTGLTDNPFLDSFAIPLGIALLAVWALKAKIFKAEEWLDARRLAYQKFTSNKALNSKIAAIRGKNRFGKLFE